jgi:hypothetical protein
MKVEIKQISIKEDSVFLLIRCCKPHQKETPWSNGREELDRNNKLFQEYAEEYRQEMKEFRKRTLKLHLGVAQLAQDGEGEQ